MRRQGLGAGSEARRGLALLLVGAAGAAPLAADEPTSAARLQILELGPVSAQNLDQRRAFDRRIEELIEAYRLEHGLLPAPQPRGQSVAAAALVPRRYPIYPFAGVHDEDVHPFDYVDLDPSAGLQDFDCGEHTYDGHDAVDFWLKSFGEQDGGVPVFAPLAGRVVHAQDGYPDRQKQCSPNTENYVIVDHGGGQFTAYGHLRRGSVRVVEGQTVAAGEELGLIASSGCSYWPHLHFRTEIDGRVVEPHAGACNPGKSGWRKQRKLRSATRVWDLGFSRRGPQSLTPAQTPPDPLPRLGRIGRNDRRLHLWAYLLNLRPHTPYRVRAFRPDGLLGYDSGIAETDNSDFQRLAVGWHTLDTSPLRGHWGTWTFELSIDGEIVVEAAPLEVRKKRKKRWNRPPATPQRVVFEPRRPKAGAPVVCVAKVDHLLEDADYDIVRYFFEWRVDGAVVRERTCAARSDVLAAGSARRGAVVTCTVVPHDDRAAGEAAAAEVRIR